MKRLFQLLFLSTIIFLSCRHHESFISNSQFDNQIVIGHIDSLYSNILKEERKIWVHLPESYNVGNEVDKYPVLYLLDGDGHFYSIAGMIRQLSTTNGNTILPEMIVVGIPNTDRTRDLTPTHVDVAFGDSNFVKTSGGGENFITFIQDELIPYVDKEYPTTDYRTLVGHSFGGLSVIYTLLTHPEIFDNYIAIDPSLWWDDQRLLSMADSILNTENYDRKSLFIAVANTLKKGMDIADLEKDTTASSNHIRSILEFSKSTAALKHNGLNFKWKYYPDDDHGSVPLIAEYEALRFMFSWHRFTDVALVFGPESTATPEQLVELYVTHHKQISKHFGYELLPQESNMNSIAYYFLGRGKPEKAHAFFDLNIKNYPESANVYDSMGDYYLAQADTVNAIAQFKKALAIEELPATKEKMEKLLRD